MVTQELLLKLFDYDPITGIVTNKIDRSSRARKGERSGTINDNGYRVIYICGKNYREHRLIWCMVYGNFPTNEIDHIDRNRSNNAIENLREATSTENSLNADYIVGLSGLRGVSPTSSGLKWRARIRVEGQQISLGHFDTVEEAHKAYLEAVKKYHGEFAYSETPTSLRSHNQWL